MACVSGYCDELMSAGNKRRKHVYDEFLRLFLSSNHPFKHLWDADPKEEDSRHIISGAFNPVKISFANFSEFRNF